MRFKRSNPVLALLLCAFLWSTGGILIKSVQWNSFAIAGLRSLIAAVFIATVTRRLPRLVVRRGNGSADRGQTLARAGAAAAYSATMILYVLANKHTTAANAILLQYTNPLWVILLGPAVLGEKNTWVEYLTVAGVLGGMALFAGEGLGGGRLFGNVMACVSGFFFGLTIVLMRKQKDTNPSDSFALSHILTFLAALPFYFSSPPPSLQSLAGVFAMGIFQIGIPSILYAAGISRVTAISAVFATMIEPLMNPVWVFLFAGEKPSLSAVAGGLVILGFISFRSVVTYRRSVRQ